MMNRYTTLKLAAALLCAWLIPVWAGGDGDHSHDAPPVGQVEVKPRLAAASDVFELVAVYEKSGLTLYLDAVSGTQAVRAAKIDYESGELKGAATAQPNGTYRIALPEKSLNANMPFVFTITAGAQSDLLAGDLVLKNSEPPLAHRWWESIWNWIKGLFGHAHAHPETPALSSSAVDAPLRQSDGAVFLPKSSQRQLGIATQTAHITESEAVQELTGRVIADPAGSSRVQAAQAGRFELAGLGFPTIGQSVKQGQILGVIRPSVGVIERANQSAQAIDLTSATETARKRLARLEQLEGTVAQKDIDAARIELQSLTERSKGIRASLTTVETLIAPTSGVISAVNVSLGQVVEAKESLFEIVDPKRLRIEAQVSPALLAGSIQSATASPNAKAGEGQQSYLLKFLGVSRTLQNGTLPMQFAVLNAPATGAAGAPDGAAGAAALAIGQPMHVFVATGDKLKGIVLPAGAVVKNQKNQSIVWVQHAPESFEPITVNTALLNGVQVLITQGLSAGDRVVVQANSLLNQIR
ncbi:MAG: HlyD family efflux transporter periplasmic adaptor subunit [Cytophagales bacterium]|nr:HlyD family efflux transporter periplasmic adaptor subunit [Cytophagales bacterium]